MRAELTASFHFAAADSSIEIYGTRAPRAVDFDRAVGGGEKEAGSQFGAHAVGIGEDRAAARLVAPRADPQTNILIALCPPQACQRPSPQP